MSEPALSPPAALVRAGDPDRFLAAMTAPPEGRERLMALYAFNLELARVPAVVSEPMIGEIRLAWWAEAVDEIFAGGPVRRHEVATPLAGTVRAAGLPRAPLDAMIAARRFDIHDEPHPDMAACRAYLADTAGALMRLSGAALAEVPEDGAAALGDLGLAQGAANLLTALPALIALGKSPLPWDARPGERNALAEGRAPDAFAAAVGDLAREGLAAHRRARAARGAIPKAAAPAARAAWRAPRALAAIANDPAAVLAFRPVSEFRRRWGLLSRALTGGW